MEYRRFVLVALVLASFPLIAQENLNHANPEKVSAKADTAESIEPDTMILAELMGSVNAKTAKPGDRITAKIHGDTWGETKIILPDRAKLVGRVVEAQARSKDHEAKLAITFEKAVLKDGTEVPLRLIIRNMAEPVPDALVGNTGRSSSFSVGPQDRGPKGTSRDERSAYIATHPSAMEPPFPSPRIPREAGAITGDSGIPDVELSSTVTATGSVSVLISSRRNIKVNNHTELFLRVVGSTPQPAIAQ